MACVLGPPSPNARTPPAHTSQLTSFTPGAGEDPRPRPAPPRAKAIIRAGPARPAHLPHPPPPLPSCSPPRLAAGPWPTRWSQEEAPCPAQRGLPSSASALGPSILPSSGPLHRVAVWGPERGLLSGKARASGSFSAGGRAGARPPAGSSGGPGRPEPALYLTCMVLRPPRPGPAAPAWQYSWLPPGSRPLGKQKVL